MASKMFISVHQVPVRDVVDIHGDRPEGLEHVVVSCDCWLVFIDLDPDANWAHPCEYILLTNNGWRMAVKHNWQPADAITMAEFPSAW